MSAKYNSKTRARTCIPSKKLVRRYMRMNTKKNKNRKALKNSETYKIKIDNLVELLNKHPRNKWDISLSQINNSFRCEYEPKNFEQDPTGTLKMLYLDGEMSKNRIVVLLSMSKHRTENNLYPLKKIFKIDEVEKSINFYFDTIIQQSQLEDK
jgi:hypothetical protein